MSLNQADANLNKRLVEIISIYQNLILEMGKLISLVDNQLVDNEQHKATKEMITNAQNYYLIRLVEVQTIVSQVKAEYAIDIAMAIDTNGRIH